MPMPTPSILLCSPLRDPWFYVPWCPLLARHLSGFLCSRHGFWAEVRVVGVVEWAEVRLVGVVCLARLRGGAEPARAETLR